MERNHKDFGDNSFSFYWNESTLFPYSWCLKRLYDSKSDDVWIKYKALVKSNCKTMSKKVKYWRIFNYRLNDLMDNVDTKNANGSGATRAMLVLTPLLLISALIELIYVRLFNKNTDKFD